MAINKTIEAVNIAAASYDEKTTVVGQPDVPGMSAAAMQESVEYMPRNLLAPKINELVEAVNESYSKAETDGAINEKMRQIGAGDMVAADYDPTESVKLAGGVPDFVSGKMEPLKCIPVELALADWTETTVGVTQTKTVLGMTADWTAGAPVWDAEAMQAAEGSVDLEAVEERMRGKLLCQPGTDEIVFSMAEAPDGTLYLIIPGMMEVS